MMDNIWFYHYEILFMDGNAECRAEGWVPAEDAARAMEKLSKYYGEPTDVLHLFAETEDVLEVEDAHPFCDKE